MQQAPVSGLQDTTSSYDRTGQTGQGETMVDKLKGAVGMGPTTMTGQVRSLWCDMHIAMTRCLCHAAFVRQHRVPLVLQDTMAYDRTGQAGQGETMVDKLKGAVGMGPTSTTGQVRSLYMTCTLP